ncbi:hypothetical protein [Thermococcus sp. LS2]|uniref:hypothetical protein n=1 Tax=Thermococcus sp. LS2 TaxID=1638260 RepID=UPI00143BEE42|nr:hypothetical protein [Thermococcus sp. LS2]NJE12884.1 hypothetical protein [Thermococcus sp. LS2]
MGVINIINRLSTKNPIKAVDIDIILIFAIFSAYFASFYITNGITMGKDGGAFLITDKATILSKFVYTWETNVHGFSAYFNLISAPFYLFLSVFDKWGLHLKAFVYWWMIFFMAFVGAFLLVLRILELFQVSSKNEKIVAFLSAFIYLISPIPVTYRWGDTNNQVFSYAIFPLALYIFVDMLFENNVRKALRKILAYSVIISILSFGFVNITLLANLVIMLSFILILNYSKVNKRSLLINGIVFTLLMSWFISGIISTSAQTVSLVTGKIQNTGKIAWISAYKKTITLYSPLLFYPTKLWNGLYAYNNYYIQPPVFIVWALFVTTVLIVNLISLKEYKSRRKYTLFSLMFLTLAIFLTLMPLGVFSPIYNFLIFKLSPFWAFRNTFDKFNYLLQIALLLITTNFISYIFSNENSLKLNKPRHLKFALLTIYITSLLIVGKPLFLGMTAYDYGGHPAKAVIPLEFLELKQTLEQQSFERSSWILYIPFSRGTWIKSTWYYGLDYTIYLPGKNTGCAAKKSNITDKLFELLSSPDFTKNETKQIELLNALIIGNYKYIIIRNDINLSAQERISASERGISNQLSNFYYFSKKYRLMKTKAFGNMYVVYTNPYVFGEIFIANNIGSYQFNKTEYSMINPTLYTVTLNLTKPSMILFAESYDPLWEARVYKDGKLVEKVSPVPVYGVINGFWVNQTGNLEIVLRYTPQDWFERGLIISLTTFILSLSYIFYDWRREKGDRWAKKLEEKFRRIISRVKIKGH